MKKIAVITGASGGNTFRSTAFLNVVVYFI